MTLTEFLAQVSTGAFLTTVPPAEILAFAIQMVGLVILLPALAIVMGSLAWWMVKTLTHPDFRLSTILISPMPMEQAQAQFARVRTGRTARIAKWSGSVGLLLIVAGAVVIVLFTDGDY